MKNRRKIKGEQNLRNNLTIWKKNDDFDILNQNFESVTGTVNGLTRKCES